MTISEISSLNYLLDAVSIAPEKFESLIKIVYREDSTNKFKEYLNQLKQAGDSDNLKFCIEKIKREIK